MTSAQACWVSPNAISNDSAPVGLSSLLLWPRAATEPPFCSTRQIDDDDAKRAGQGEPLAFGTVMPVSHQNKSPANPLGIPLELEHKLGGSTGDPQGILYSMTPALGQVPFSPRGVGRRWKEERATILVVDQTICRNGQGLRGSTLSTKIITQRPSTLLLQYYTVLL